MTQCKGLYISPITGEKFEIDMTGLHDEVIGRLYDVWSKIPMKDDDPEFDRTNFFKSFTINEL